MSDSHDIQKLETEIKALHEIASELAIDDGFHELITSIHAPGYTTPAEFNLVSALVISMRVQIGQLTVLKETLITASREIVEAHERVEAMV